MALPKFHFLLARGGGSTKMLNKQSLSYKIKETIVLELIAIALTGILLVTCLYSSIGDKVIWIGIAIALIELIDIIANDSLEFFYLKVLEEQS